MDLVTGDGCWWRNLRTEERAGRRGGREEPFLRDGRVRRGKGNFWECLK